MVAASIKKVIKSIFIKSNTKQKTFNFPELPYVCQRRFAEICDPQTLKCFASINSTTRNLVKRCHFIKDADIDYEDTAIYYISCYCNEDDYCKGVNDMDLTSFKNKFNVMNMTTFRNYGEKKTDAQLFQTLPIKLNSVKDLILYVNMMDFKELKNLIKQGMKCLIFLGGIEADCSLNKFMEFLRSISKLNFCMFILIRSQSSLTFDYNDLVQRCKIDPKHFKNMLYHNAFLGIIKL